MRSFLSSRWVDWLRRVDVAIRASFDAILYGKSPCSSRLDQEYLRRIATAGQQGRHLIPAHLAQLDIGEGLLEGAPHATPPNHRPLEGRGESDGRPIGDRSRHADDAVDVLGDRLPVLPRVAGVE